MSFKFTSHRLLGGLFEPEGLYLSPPLEGPLLVLHGWGADSALYAQWRYNGVPLKGHTGIDFALQPEAKLLATDTGRVVEIAVERGGFERYIKIEHRWGESLYGCVGTALVESGQTVQRGDVLAQPRKVPPAPQDPEERLLFFHFGIRVHPFNRYDGWGGFTDPTPYLPPGSLSLESRDEADLEPSAGRLLHSMADERQGIRRP